MTVVKLRSKRSGIHVHDNVYVGPDVDHLAFVGTLVLDVGQWQELGAALRLGSRQMKGRLTVIFEGDEDVVAEGDAPTRSSWIDALPEDVRSYVDEVMGEFAEKTIPMVEASAIVMSHVPESGEYNVKLMLETGAAILLDKPILAVVPPGVNVPEKLRRAADEVVEVDLADTDGGKERLVGALHRMMASRS